MVNASTAQIPQAIVYVQVDIPDEVRLDVLEVSALPARWFEFPAPPECQHAGDLWASRGKTVGLIVPSAVARIEKNLLLNPAHPDFSRLTIGSSEEMGIDRRLRRGASRRKP